MITLEQVKLLETKVTKAIDTIQHLTEENKLLREKLEGYQGRIHELEVLIQRFKDDQGKIEAGIISTLNRLNKFEDILELELSTKHPSENLDNMSEPAVLPRDTPFRPATAQEEPLQGEAMDPDSDEAILSILEQEAKARQSTGGAPVAPEAKEASSDAELDIF